MGILYGTALRGAVAGSALLAHRRLGSDDADDMSFDFATGNGVVDQLLVYIIIVILVCLSGLFSGLTLGLLGLDMTGLEIVIGGGSDEEKVWAKKVLTVRKDGNRLLCTLLLGNVAVNSLLAITMASIVSSLYGFLGSTVIIVIFGEILPQASCSRYALEIGAATLPIMRVILFILGPLAVPLGWCLDHMLEEDVGTVHTRGEMMEYMKVHLENKVLDVDASNVMRGALEMREKEIAEVMTPLEDVFMLPDTTRLSFKVVREIFEQGFSRIPVFAQGERGNIVGLLFVKDLIFVDPEDETPLSSLLSIFHREVQIVDEDMSLNDVLRIFKRGRGHLALVRSAKITPVVPVEAAKPEPLTPRSQTAIDKLLQSAEDERSPREDGSLTTPKERVGGEQRSPRHSRMAKAVTFFKAPFGSQAPRTAVTLANKDTPGGASRAGHFPRTPVEEERASCGLDARGGGGAGLNRTFVGIVTLEDIVEEIIGDEIIDETDVFVDVDEQIKVEGRSAFDFTRLRRLDVEYVDEKLSPEEVLAISAHLVTNVAQLRGSHDGSALRSLTRDEMAVLVRRSRVVELKRVSAAHAEVISPDDRLYTRGEPAAFATLVLNGKLTVLAGKDGFRADAGPWSVLGADALVNDEGFFVPDFSAHIATESVRCVYVRRAEYVKAATKRKSRPRGPERGLSQREEYFSESDMNESHGRRFKRSVSRSDVTERRRRLASQVSEGSRRASIPPRVQVREKGSRSYSEDAADEASPHYAGDADDADDADDAPDARPARPVNARSVSAQESLAMDARARADSDEAQLVDAADKLRGRSPELSGLLSHCTSGDESDSHPRECAGSVESDGRARAPATPTTE